MPRGGPLVDELGDADRAGLSVGTALAGAEGAGAEPIGGTSAATTLFGGSGVFGNAALVTPGVGSGFGGTAAGAMALHATSAAIARPAPAIPIRAREGTGRLMAGAGAVAGAGDRAGAAGGGVVDG